MKQQRSYDSDEFVWLVAGHTKMQLHLKDQAFSACYLRRLSLW